MELSASDIKEIQQLYRKKYGIELDDKTARYKLLKLVRQMYVIYQPITDEQLQAYRTKNEHMNEENRDEKKSTK